MNTDLKPQRFLTIPLGKEFAYIPLGISPEDYQLLIDSLDLWHGRIAPKESAELPIQREPTLSAEEKE